jgi:hypothetical protein
MKPPAWNPCNLRHHYQKRAERDAGCFEDLLGIPTGQLTEDQYERRSQEAFDNAWGVYEGDSWDVDRREYRSRAAYFVDDELVVVITDTFQREFITCFHEHFDFKHAKSPASSMTSGQRRFKYRDRLQADEQGGMIRNVSRCRGF